MLSYSSQPTLSAAHNFKAGVKNQRKTNFYLAFQVSLEQLYVLISAWHRNAIVQTCQQNQGMNLNEFLCYDEYSQKDHELGNLFLNAPYLVFFFFFNVIHLTLDFYIY